MRRKRDNETDWRGWLPSFHSGAPPEDAGTDEPEDHAAEAAEASDPLDALESMVAASVEEHVEAGAEQVENQADEVEDPADQVEDEHVEEPVESDATTLTCPACGERCPAGARFCLACGERLTGELPASEPITGVGSTSRLEVVEETPLPVPGETPFVGRAAERALLLDAFDRAVSAGTGEAVVVIGEPGIGKTRLVMETFRELAGSANLVRVQCRSPEDGGPTWPLADVVEQIVGITGAETGEETRAALLEHFGDVPDAERLVARLCHILGAADDRGSPDETRWALRRFLEAAARERPLALWLEDIDLADPSFWRLAGGAGRRMRDASLLLVATSAREPELVDGANALIRLQPLPEEEAVEILDALLEGRALDAEGAGALARTCHGNPFLLEQAIALLVDRGDLGVARGPWEGARDLEIAQLPDDPRRLTDARIGSLPLEERAVLGLVAVFGDVFPWSAAPELLPGGAREIVREHLGSLVNRRLLVADGEDILRFRHPIIREVTLLTVPREARAEVHRRAARWLERSAGASPARIAELVGSHLASATSLDPTAGGSEEVARRAVDLLSAAAERADVIGDAAGVAGLLTRAASLLPPADPLRTALLLRRAEAHEAAGDLRPADLAAADALRLARVAGDRTIEWRAKVLRARLAVAAGEPHAEEAARELAERAIEHFGVLADSWGLAWAWALSELAHRSTGHAAASVDVAERIAEHARAAGRRRDELTALRSLARATADAPGPLPEAIERCEAIERRLEGERPGQQEVASILALLVARAGRLDEARERIAPAMRTLEELGADAELAACLHSAGTIHTLARNAPAAERALRAGMLAAERAGDDSLRAGLAATLAHAFATAGRAEEALILSETAEAAQGDEPATRVMWRASRARAFAALDRIAEADRLARAAVRMAEQTDSPELRASALLDLAEVVRVAGRSNEAAPIARRSLRISERRGSESGAAAARTLLDSIAGRLQAEPGVVRGEVLPSVARGEVLPSVAQDEVLPSVAQDEIEHGATGSEG